MGRLEEVNVALSEDLSETIEEAVSAGEFASADAVVQSALENWQAGRKASAELKRLWDEGIASGPVEQIDADRIKEEGRRRLNTLRPKSG